MPRQFADDQLRRYLLNDLAEGDESSLEAACFADPSLFARIEDAEQNLADDYVTGRLQTGERRKFERHVLATAAGRERVSIARALRHAAGKVFVEARGRHEGH